MYDIMDRNMFKIQIQAFTRELASWMGINGFTSKDYDNDGDIDLFTRYFHNNGCNIMHHSNYESEESRTV